MARGHDTMSASAPSERELTTRALAGDEGAFAELFALHERGLYNVCYRLTGSREDAADLTQEAFLRVFARLPDLGGREVNLAAYLYRTARNLAYDQSARRARETPIEDVSLLAGADQALERDPERATLLLRQQEEVRAANGRLPERQRLVLALREMDERSYAEIGEVLEINEGAVAQLLVRARLRLRRELRLEQVDPERMAPACRDRLADIGALIDGELDADRRQVLSAHMAACEQCQASRAAFEEARTTYRAWLPLLAIGLGAEVARAAETRGLLGDRPEERWRRRGRRALIAAAILVSLAVVGAVPTVVSNRQDIQPTTAEPPQAEAPPARQVTMSAERVTRPNAATRPPAARAAPIAPAPAPAPAPAAVAQAAAGTTTAPPPPPPPPIATAAAARTAPAPPAAPRRARVATAPPTPAPVTDAPSVATEPAATEPPPATEPPATTTEAPPPTVTEPPRTTTTPPQTPPRLPTLSLPIRPPLPPPNPPPVP